MIFTTAVYTEITFPCNNANCSSRSKELPLRSRCAPFLKYDRPLPVGDILTNLAAQHYTVSRLCGKCKQPLSGDIESFCMLHSVTGCRGHG